MKIRLSDVLNSIGESKTILQTLPLEAIQIQSRLVEFPEKITVKATVTNTQDAILLRVKLKGIALLKCTRCLEDFRWPFGIEFIESYDKKGENSINLNQMLDISEEIYQNITVNIPMQIVCGEDCQGICPGCGANRNHSKCECQPKTADPRWQKLQSFLKK